MKPLNTATIDSILIRAANWVGDAIMSTPFIRSVKYNFPKAHISILAKPWVSPLFENLPYINEILIYDDQGRHNGNLGKMRLSRDLKQKRFDAAFLIQNAFEAALITYLAQIPYRVGYNTDFRTWLLSHPVKLDQQLKKGHLIDYYLGILSGVGLSNDSRKQDLSISSQEKKWAETFLKSKNIRSTDTIIGINPGATYGTAKRWFPERFAALGKKISKQVSSKFLIFGAPSEAELGKKISIDIGKNAINLCGKTSLREALALISKCRLFVTNDSGLMHAAAALEIPLIAIFGSTDHIATPPSSTSATVVRVPMDCSPCLKPDCPEKHHNCMHAITVDMVLSQALEFLKTPAIA